jgi:hypothetical protein
MRPSLPIVVFVVLLIHTQMMLVHAAFCDDRASGYYCDGNSRVHCVRYYRSGKYNTYKLETFTCTQGCISTGSDSARCKSTPCQQVLSHLYHLTLLGNRFWCLQRRSGIQHSSGNLTSLLLTFPSGLQTISLVPLMTSQVP